ncbi:hypothetical protein [Fulvivirga sediminis]|uniref:Uncharacterized protein n=1 Tax=Fulvivirga sediminis TaxID=2803949 RepID=A0A937F7L8_9BACT|nr:hypothetical protein [Fulvivirga sediminis]MBL3655473.1 hypothetical protein [Fulvivirga sediminis]
MMTLAEFKEQLQISLKEELDLGKSMVENEIIAGFDFGVFPWSGYFELSFLTKKEVEEYGDEFKYDIAAWKFYNFNGFQENTEKTIYNLGLWMLNYYKETNDGQLFFNLCAEILKDPEVVGSLNQYNLSDDFEVSVYDPDDADFSNYAVESR